MESEVLGLDPYCSTSSDQQVYRESIRRPRDRRQRTPLTLLVATSLIYLAFLPPGIYSVDGNSMLAVAESLVMRHNTAVPVGLGIVGRGGQTYSSWYPLQSVLAVPFVAVGAVAAEVFHQPAHYVEALAAQILPALCTAATVPFVYLIAKLLGSPELGAWLAAISYAFGTIAMVYTRAFFAEPLLALLTAVSFYLGFKDKIWPVTALAVMAVLAKPTGILVRLELSMYLLMKRRSLLNALPATGSGIGLALYFIYNYYRFGNPLTFGQSWNRFSLSSVPRGVSGLLVSPGAGLMWFCPCVILAIIAAAQVARRLEVLAIIVNLAGFVAVHSLWQDWSGGWSWGPRYLLPALPGLMAITGILRGKLQKILVVLATIGFLISAPTLISFYERYYAEATERGISDASLLWCPEDSPILHAWPAAIRQIHDASKHDVRELFRERGVPARTIESSRALQIVAIWWWALPIMRIPRIVGVATSVLLISIGVLLTVRSYPGSVRGSPSQASVGVFNCDTDT